jgi:hypothetical protein
MPVESMALQAIEATAGGGNGGRMREWHGVGGKEVEEVTYLDEWTVLALWQSGEAQSGEARRQADGP